MDVASGAVDQLTAKVELAAARGETTSCKSGHRYGAFRDRDGSDADGIGTL